MAQAIISRRGGGSGYATITFNGVSALKRTGAAALRGTKSDLEATAVGDYALFGGGHGSGNLSTVDAYNASLTRSTPTELFSSNNNR